MMSIFLNVGAIENQFGNFLFEIFLEIETTTTTTKIPNKTKINPTTKA